MGPSLLGKFLEVQRQALKMAFNNVPCSRKFLILFSFFLGRSSESKIGALIRNTECSHHWPESICTQFFHILKQIMGRSSESKIGALIRNTECSHHWPESFNFKFFFFSNFKKLCIYA